jgi:hypothetical protein
MPSLPSAATRSSRPVPPPIQAIFKDVGLRTPGTATDVDVHRAILGDVEKTLVRIITNRDAVESFLTDSPRLARTPCVHPSAAATPAASARPPEAQVPATGGEWSEEQDAPWWRISPGGATRRFIYDAMPVDFVEVYANPEAGEILLRTIR